MTTKERIYFSKLRHLYEFFYVRLFGCRKSVQGQMVELTLMCRILMVAERLCTSPVPVPTITR